MRSKGIPEEDLFSFLQSTKLQDKNHRFILSSMCTIPHPVAVRAHALGQLPFGEEGLTGCAIPALVL